MILSLLSSNRMPAIFRTAVRKAVLAGALSCGLVMVAGAKASVIYDVHFEISQGASYPAANNYFDFKLTCTPWTGDAVYGTYNGAQPIYKITHVSATGKANGTAFSLDSDTPSVDAGKNDLGRSTTTYVLKNQGKFGDAFVNNLFSPTPLDWSPSGVWITAGAYEQQRSYGLSFAPSIKTYFSAVGMGFSYGSTNQYGGWFGADTYFYNGNHANTGAPIYSPVISWNPVFLLLPAVTTATLPALPRRPEMRFRSPRAWDCCCWARCRWPLDAAAIAVDLF